MLKVVTNRFNQESSSFIFSRIYLYLSIIAVLGLLSVNLYADRDPAHIPDINFKRAINYNLNRPVNYQPSIDDLIGLTGDFIGYDRHIQSIVGAELMVNITGIHLDGNLISDITPLTGLINLTGMNLMDNQITNINALAGLD